MGVKRQMFADEAGDEVVAVVVAVLHPQRQRLMMCGAGGLQMLRKELFGQKLVRRAVIDQGGRERRAGIPPRAARVGTIARSSG